MPNYFGSSPWTDAAQYGRGFGDTIAEALLQMPQQRAQMALQAQQLGMQQKFELARLAEQQRAAQAEQMLGAQELDVNKQRMIQEQELHKAQLAGITQKNALLEKGAFKPWKDPDTGATYLYNDRTAEVKPFPSQQQGFGGGPLKPAQQDAMLNNVTRMIQGLGAGAFSANGDDQQKAYMWNQYTNAIPKVLPGLLSRVQQMQGLSGGVTNAPAPMGLPTTNAPVQGLPAQPAPRVFRYNPDTQALEQ